MARRRRLLLVVAAAGLTLAADGVLRPALRAPTDAVPGPRGDGPATLRAPGPAVAPGRAARVADAPAPAALPALPGAPRTVRPGAGRAVHFGLPGGLPADPVPGSPGEAARRLVEAHRGALGLDAMPGELRVADERTDVMGHHLRFRQVVGGVPVEGSVVAAHVGVDALGRSVPLLLTADVFPVAGAATVPGIGAGDAVAAVRALLAEGDDAAEDEDGGEAVPFEHKAPELLIRPERRADGTFGRLVWRVDATNGEESVRVSVDAADGDVVDLRDLRRAAESTGKARVFRPNPVHAARGGAFSDRRDATSPLLEMWMEEVDLPRLDGTGYVRGRWCDAARGRGNLPVSNNDWRGLTRDDDLFELVNAYWHVDRAQAELQRLGFADVNAEAQRVSAHHIPQDQSYYDDYNDEIRFGDGGVDDAEDGDVVVHEYGHAIQAAMVPGFGGTAEGRAVGEGFSDYLACTLHSDPAAPDPEWDPLVAAWDATSYSDANPPFLRRTNRDKVYPRDVVDEPHADGEIWSRFLWDVRSRLGADDAMRVIVGSHSYMNADSRFKEAANAVLVANLYLRDGRDDPALRSLLRERGLPFNQPPLDAPPEDVFDDSPGNDDATRAAPLAPGSWSDLLLADDDWYRVSLGPFRRLRVAADFDPVDLDLDLEVRTVGSAVISESRGVSGQEVVTATTGAEGADLLVRAFRGGETTAIDGYSLLVQDLDLEVAQPGRTTTRRTAPGATDALLLTVAPEKVAAGKRFVVETTARRGGARNDVRVTSPSGTVVADFGTGRTNLGARVAVPATETGAWRIELRSRDGTGGAFTFRARFRKAR